MIPSKKQANHTTTCHLSTMGELLLGIIYDMFTWCMLKYNNKDTKLYFVTLMSIYTTNSSASYSLQRKQYLWSPNLCFVSLKMHEIFSHATYTFEGKSPHRGHQINNAYFIIFIPISFRKLLNPNIHCNDYVKLILHHLMNYLCSSHLSIS